MEAPIVVFGLALALLWLAGWTGARLRRRRPSLEEGERENLDMLLTLTLTLLGLIIGFSFSMAVGRYDQRKNYEEAEANAIGTEYVRAGLLPPAEAVQVRALLRRYLEQRVRFYVTSDDQEEAQINAATAQLQTDLWAAVEATAAAQPTPVIALAVAGMNDVLNSQGYTQAAWWNRIPTAAWGLMAVIAMAGSILVGYKARPTAAKRLRAWVLPLIVAVAFCLIADMDSPRHGFIRVRPQNLLSLAQSLPGH